MRWAYRYRGGVTLFEAAQERPWRLIYHLARSMRNGFETYVWHNGRWTAVL